MFITFEGGEGSGKSTQIKLLGEWLRGRGQSVVETREPGGSIGANEIRQLLVLGEVDRWDAISETLLLFAARRDHVIRTIEPALKERLIVLCDRYQDSTIAYQGYGHKINTKVLKVLFEFAINGLNPTLTFLLDIPANEGIDRSIKRQSSELRFESFDINFHERVRQGFLELAMKNPNRIIKIDGLQTIDNIHEIVKSVFIQKMQESTKPI